MVQVERRSHGIVLKKHMPRKQKLSVLDVRYGRIEVIPSRRMLRAPICHGALIEYSIVKRESAFFVDEIVIVEVPHYASSMIMLFFHHALEVVYFTVPIEAQAPEIYQLLYDAIRFLPAISEHQLASKVIMAQLFLQLGEFDVAFAEILRNPVLGYSIEDILAIPIDPALSSSLDSWLYHCITHHPCVGMFKTIQFLTDGTEYE